MVSPKEVSDMKTTKEMVAALAKQAAEKAEAEDATEAAEPVAKAEEE